MNLELYLRRQLQSKPITLMTHIIAGYPSLEDNLKELEIMARHGVDLVEIQMPFSEPVADGPLFAEANQLAIRNGMTLDRYFKFMGQVTRSFGFPVLFMGYYNSVYKMGEQNFIDHLKESGACGCIVADLPLEECDELSRRCRQSEQHLIPLVAPNTPDQRLEAIGKCGSGFVYAVARQGVTGRQTQIDQELEHYLERCRKRISLPLGVGFGIRERSDIDRLIGKADLAIIGSKVLDTWMNGGAEALDQWLAGITAG